MSKDENKEGNSNSNNNSGQRPGMFSMFSLVLDGASNMGGNEPATPSHSDGAGAGFFSAGTLGNWFTSNKRNITEKDMNAVAPISF